jgi:hypothetical protein
MFNLDLVWGQDLKVLGLTKFTVWEHIYVPSLISLLLFVWVLSEFCIYMSLWYLYCYMLLAACPFDHTVTNQSSTYKWLGKMSTWLLQAYCHWVRNKLNEWFSCIPKLSSSQDPFFHPSHVPYANCSICRACNKYIWVLWTKIYWVDSMIM